METIKRTTYTKKSFDDRIVRYEEIHKVKEQDYKALIEAIDPQEGEKIFEGCAGYADVSKRICEATKEYKVKPEIYIQDESLVQMNRAKTELALPEDHMLLGDIRTIEMSDNSFDKAVIKMGVHELLKNEQRKVFAEIYRILKPGGKFVIWELSLNKDNQEIFQDIIRKKDELSGFETMVNNRYFQRHDELEVLFFEAGFQDIKDEYKMRYTFNPQGRFEELVSKDRLELIKLKGKLSEEDKQELKQKSEERVMCLVDYIRGRIPEDKKPLVDYKDLGNDLEITVDKIIMSGTK
jgi:ubiquinone/menaquinone biosynthesis C-methylase UbiE